MPLNKVKPGSNMYQGWITHTHNHLAGACPHSCTYCSTQDMARRFPVMAERYIGPSRLIEKELLVDYGKRWRPDKDSPWRTEKTIFVENCGDLFAEGINASWIISILQHCREYPENTYVFQTKNPRRIENPEMLFKFIQIFPPRFMIGTTAETNWFDSNISYIAPHINQRLDALAALGIPSKNKFITIEPIMEFSIKYFLPMLLKANVPTIYIGADSKGHGLPEPTGPEIGELIKGLRDAGKKVILKSNLKRLYDGN